MRWWENSNERTLPSGEVCSQNNMQQFNALTPELLASTQVSRLSLLTYGGCLAAYGAVRCLQMRLWQHSSQSGTLPWSKKCWLQEGGHRAFTAALWGLPDYCTRARLLYLDTWKPGMSRQSCGLWTIKRSLRSWKSCTDLRWWELWQTDPQSWRSSAMTSRNKGHTI